MRIYSTEIVHENCTAKIVLTALIIALHTANIVIPTREIVLDRWKLVLIEQINISIDGK